MYYRLRFEAVRLKQPSTHLLQIRGVVRQHPSLARISFVAHSLGGLISRYAISVLYTSLPPYHPECQAGSELRNGNGKARSGNKHR